LEANVTKKSFFSIYIMMKNFIIEILKGVILVSH
jgi:hypothetical protein